MTSAAPVIHICGFPGSGKFTIGRCLAGRIGGRLLHNHLALDPASALFDREDARHAALREEVRARIYAAARTLEQDVPIIVTDALQETDRDRALFESTVALAEARGAALEAITLVISCEENRRRLLTPARTQMHKLASAEVLETLRETSHLLKPAGAIELDVTHLTAAQSAEAIMRLLDLNEADACA